MRGGEHQLCRKYSSEFTPGARDSSSLRFKFTYRAVQYVFLCAGALPAMAFAESVWAQRDLAGWDGRIVPTEFPLSRRVRVPTSTAMSGKIQILL
jgi:hypothetical protein